MPEQDVDGGEQRERVYRAALKYGTSPEAEERFRIALDRLIAFIAAKAKVEALREQPCRSLIGTDCMTLAVEHPSLGGDHDMCRRCTPLAAAEAAFAALQRDQEAG